MFRDGEQSIIRSSEGITRGQRVFRVPERYGLGFGVGDVLSNRDVEYDRLLLREMRKYGFSVQRGGQFNFSNPLEIGVFNDDTLTQRDKCEQVASTAGIEMPCTLTPQEVLAVQNPVVAKITAMNRGRNKYLLEIEKQKVRFIAWALMRHDLPYLSEQPNSAALVEEAFRKVQQGKLEDKCFKYGGWLDCWIFEEYIDTPGKYNTSFRIVADGFGNVHYGLIAHSEEARGTVLMPVPKTTHPPLEEFSIPGKFASILLEHPDSPFYIAPKKFVSNIILGGKAIVLNGIPKQKLIDREILADLGISPDNPTIPPILLSTSQLIGRLSRDQFPFVGIDYLMRRDGSFVLLEINSGPGLRPEALGCTDTGDRFVCERELIKRMVQQIG